MRLGLRIVVALLCAAALLQAMRPAVHSTRMGVESVRALGSDAPVTLFRQQLEFIGKEMHRQIPAGTKVLIIDPVPEWRLRLIELAVLEGLVIVDSAPELEVFLEWDESLPMDVRLVTRKPAA